VTAAGRAGDPGGADPAGASGAVPAALAGRLFAVDDALLVARYGQALDALGAGTTALPRFHVDALGYSPEIACERGDPCYLGQGPDHPSLILLSVDQLAGPILQPNAGFAGPAFRTVEPELGPALAALTLAEPVFGEISHEASTSGGPERLGLVTQLKLALETPSRRVETARELETLREHLATSEHDWHDEAFVARMLERARIARGLVPVPGPLAGGALPVQPCFVLHGGGCYVIPAGSGAAAAPATVIARPAASRPDVDDVAPGVVRAELSVTGALTALRRLDWIRTDAPLNADRLERVEELETWIALAHLAAAGPERARRLRFPALRAAMRRQEAVPPDYLELESIRLAASASRRRPLLARLSPITQLRLAEPAPGPAPRRALVRHLQAYLDPVDLGLAWTDAPDLFWSRWARLAPVVKGHFLAWVSSREVDQTP
jgi:hypothetical protein